MDIEKKTEQNIYNEEYYRSHCGPIPYKRDSYWINCFGNIADNIVRAFAPRKAFDAGCAIGLLVECLWDRGVETHGRDVSSYALEQARPDIRPYLEEGSIAEPINEKFDFISCIEVFEHLEDATARKAIAQIAASTSRVLFSSTPVDFDEPTHVNVRPSLYWLELWADAGFAPNITHDAGYLAPHAYVLERSEEGRSYRDLVSFADRIRHRLALASLGTQCVELREELSRTRAACETQNAVLKSQSDEMALERKVLQKETLDMRHKIKIINREKEKLLYDLNKFRGDYHHQETKMSELRENLERSNRERDLHQAHHAAVVNSTVWKATSKVLAFPPLAAPRSRRLMRRGARFVRSLRALQLRGGPKGFRERLRLLSSSAFFDSKWYLGRYPDVAMSGLDPAIHYARFGYLENRTPHPEFDVERYRFIHPAADGTPGEIFFEALRNDTVKDGIPPRSGTELSASRRLFLAPSNPALNQVLETAHDIVERRFPDLTPLAVYASPGVKRRITVVTDSIGRESLYGGVGTALLFSALAANRLGADLRIVTRSQESSADPLTALFAGSGVSWEGNVEILYSPKGFEVEGHNVPVSEHDLFVTTSWWTTRSTLQAVGARKVIQFIQEDERMFYPMGDEFLRCSEVFSTNGTLKIVNSNILLDHFRRSGVLEDAIAFEPSFPSELYYCDVEKETAAKQKKKFFFYARPHNYRNLYYRGLEVICACIERGILNPDEWDFYFAGHGTGAISLPRNTQSITPGVMTWPEYAGFIREMDLGLSLMYTPHPSYPPLDLAASGCVVVTNKCGIKTNLDKYSENIICADPDLESLVSATREALALSADIDEKQRRYARNGLARNWTESMAPALDRLESWVRV
ncbi:methyltransferase domain-containing protein [Asaia sp. BMEF1]|uniref:class I SAM-dependent methyltransferase n=1 Tax=Asaia sp. BMEF1 TaxID=3155932 RepID=UPI003F67ED7F